MVTNFQEMVKAQMHIGHETSKWHPKMEPYIYSKKNGMYFINLTKTLSHLKKVCQFLEKAASQGKTFLFVGTKKPASKLIAKAACECNSHFVNTRWLGGILTNWESIQFSIKKLRELEIKEKNKEFDNLPKKQAATYKKHKQKLEKYLSGLQNMKAIPDVVIIIGQLQEMNAVKECKKLNLRNVTILDTDCNPLLADLFIPANDDAVSSIKIILNELVQAIISGQTIFQKKTI